MPKNSRLTNRPAELVVSAVSAVSEALEVSVVLGFSELLEALVARVYLKQLAPDSKLPACRWYRGTQLPQQHRASFRCPLTMHDRFERKQPTAWMYRKCVRRALSTPLARSPY
ncbi:MAG: hypothetical protein ACI92N_002460 [Pseudomonadales bacterium]|jgi:hypothetical protein